MSVLIMNQMLQLTEYKVALTPSLVFVTDFIKQILEHDHNKNECKMQTNLNIQKMEHNKKADGIPDVPQMWIAEELGIPCDNS